MIRAEAGKAICFLRARYRAEVEESGHAISIDEDIYERFSDLGFLPLAATGSGQIIFADKRPEDIRWTRHADFYGDDFLSLPDEDRDDAIRIFESDFDRTAGLHCKPARIHKGDLVLLDMQRECLTVNADRYRSDESFKARCSLIVRWTRDLESRWHDSQSALISAWRYDRRSGRLELTFRSSEGEVRSYPCSPDEYHAFLSAPSKGSFYHNVLKPSKELYDNFGMNGKETEANKTRHEQDQAISVK